VPLGRNFRGTVIVVLITKLNLE